MICDVPDLKRDVGPPNEPPLIKDNKIDGENVWDSYSDHKVPPKGFCGSLCCVLSQELRHTCFFGGPEQGVVALFLSLSND